MYKICFFVPENSATPVKKAMFDAGAGRLGHYEQCSFEVSGTGQFKPLLGAVPFIGTVGELEYVKELKVEMVCTDECLKKVIAAMKENHPYEMPAFDVIKLVDIT